MTVGYFGYFGSPKDSAGLERLQSYGAGLSIAPTAANTHGQTLAAVWAPQLRLIDGLLVAFQGAPAVALRNSGRTEAASATRLANLYRDFGESCLKQLFGSFALSICDLEKNILLLAVDRMGIERLTFANTGDFVAFSNSAMAVACAPGVGNYLSHQAIYNYLLLHMVSAPHTIYKNVNKLRAGTCAVLRDGAVRISRYWHPDFVDQSDADPKELQAELHRCLAQGVTNCAPDIQTGAFLSGGLDSSTVAAYLGKTSGCPAKTYSIGFGYPEFDELSYARIAARRFNFDSREQVVHGESIREALPLIAQAFDEPFGNSSALPVYYCLKFAKENGITQMLAGDGGDELFAGNSRYADHQIFERYKSVPAVLRLRLLEPLLRMCPAALAVGPIRKARGYVAKANMPLPERLEMWNLLRLMGAAAFVHQDLLTSIDPEAVIDDMREVWNEASTGDLVNRMMWFDWQYTLSDNDLRKVGTMSALVGLPVAYPMLDDGVVSLSLRVPPAQKMHGLQLRSFYKRAMRGFLPDAIIDKKKHGFGLPIGYWLRDCASAKNLIHGNLQSLRKRKLVRDDIIDKVLSLHGNNDANYYGVFLWVLAMLEQWLQEHRSRVSF